MTLWLLTSDQPVLFVLLSGVVFLGWGETFSLFLSSLTDTFGIQHATTNYGFLYRAQGIGSIFGGPVAALLHQQTESWYPVFAVAICFDRSPPPWHSSCSNSCALATWPSTPFNCPTRI